MFKRLLVAGKAEVYNIPPPSHASITHVMAKPMTEKSKSHNAPCFPVSHIVQHLFGSNCADMHFNVTGNHPGLMMMKTSFVDVDFSNLETELRTHVIKQEATETDFSNVGSMIECGLFAEALDSIRNAMFPGFLPPASHLISLLEYAQQGSATSVFRRNFLQVMYNLLSTNPPWLPPSRVRKYFSQVLQCPRCKTGLWPFLQTNIRDFVLAQGTGVSQASASGSLLYGTFWTVWERSTLLSQAVKQLTQLIVQAATEDYAERDERQRLHLANTLLDLLSVLVEFWCQQHFKLNQNLVENGLSNLAEHFAVVSQGETLLHRACKRNQVETVLQILALPGTDVNVEDHAGWTPLHEACNHGSAACVEALLRHRPVPVLHNQVAGVSPLHDALLNGHTDIAKMLLEHAGSVLLQRTDGDGRTALDLVPGTSQREELLHSAEVGDSALRNHATEVLNLPLLEVGSSLLLHLIFSYQQERGLPGPAQASDKAHSLGYRLVRALETHSHREVTLGWTDPRAVRLVEDVETLLELRRGMYLGQVSQAIKECKGQNTLFLMETLENLKSRAEAHVTDL
ncbi:hypothetical protein F2P81_013447 [Scophthalmus maximus]|uniref:TopBP1/SLF1 BRCT domain-containing protein n=1 Tax=Scophthalmus maximus TaxID=52904 RepID=A0A6A4SQU2_SCOMX|nr:hypothetical protein F2P81_013447 [Scophthalmus maximus]